MKKGMIISLLLLSGLILSAEDLTISEYIKNAKDDYRLQGKKEIVNSVGASSKNTPLLKSVELRTETENFDILRQKYAFRFYFKGIGETKSSNIVINGTKNLYNLEYQIDFIDILLERYSTILSYLEMKKTMELLDSMRSILEDRVAVLRKINTLSADANLTEIVDAEDAITDIDLEKIKLENTVSSIEYIIRDQTGADKTISFNANELISIDKIEESIDKIDPAQIASNINFEYRKQRVALAENELSLEKAKTYDFLSYFSLDYDTQNYDVPRNSFSIGLGINLPGIKNKEIEISKKKVGYMKEKLQCEKEQKDIEEKIRNNISSIKRLSKQYKFLIDRKQNDEAATSLKKYISIEGTNPLTILKLKESVIKDELKQVTIASNIYIRYITLLNLLGILSQNPDENYLIKNAVK